MRLVALSLLAFALLSTGCAKYVWVVPDRLPPQPEGEKLDVDPDGAMAMARSPLRELLKPEYKVSHFVASRFQPERAPSGVVTKRKALLKLYIAGPEHCFYGTAFLIQDSLPSGWDKPRVAYLSAPFVLPAAVGFEDKPFQLYHRLVYSGDAVVANSASLLEVKCSAFP